MTFVCTLFNISSIQILNLKYRKHFSVFILYYNIWKSLRTITAPLKKLFNMSHLLVEKNIRVSNTISYPLTSHSDLTFWPHILTSHSDLTFIPSHIYKPSGKSLSSYPIQLITNSNTIIYHTTPNQLNHSF